MVQDVIKTVGAGGDHATLAEFAAALPPDLVAVDQRWIAVLGNGAPDPGGAVFSAVCDPTRCVIVRAAAGDGPGDRMNPCADPLRAQPGKGAMIAAQSGDAVRAEGAGTRLALARLQIIALAGAAVSADGAAEVFSVSQCVLEADGAEPAVSLRGTGAISHSTVVQRGSGDGIALHDGALAEACTVAKPPRTVADGVGITFGGAPGAGARSCFVTGFGRAYAAGAATAAALVSDQTNLLAVADDFADPYWTAISSTIDPANTVPGPHGVALQRLGNNLNAFARFDGPVVASLAPGERFAFSIVVAQPTALISAIVLDSTGGRPELRVTWTDTPPTAVLIGQTAAFAARVGSLTDLGGGAWRLYLEAENTTAAALDVTPSVYVTRGVENSGLDVGFHAGEMMAGIGHLGTGFVEAGALPGTGSIEGVDPADAVMSVTDGAEDLRPVPAGPLAGAGASEGGVDLYLRHRDVPDTVGAVTLNPATQIVPVDGEIRAGLDAVRLIDQGDVLTAAARRTVLPGGPIRRIGI